MFKSYLRRGGAAYEIKWSMVRVSWNKPKVTDVDFLIKM
jgi:hypothetical protein